MADEQLEVVDQTEVIPDSQEESSEGERQETAPSEPSDIEKRAIEMGWRPKEDFAGDDSDFIPAEEFVRRKPLFDKIEHQSRELREIKKTLKALQDHHTKVKETEFTRAVNYLKTQKKSALEDGDHDRVVEIDDQISDIKAAHVAQKQAEQFVDNQPDPRFVQWVQNNSWYAQDPELRAFADQVGMAYANSNPDVDPVDVLKYVTGRVKKAYSDKFENPARKQPSPVGGSSTSKPVKSDGFKLTEEEERVMKQFVRQGILTKEEYIKDIKRMRGAE